MQVIVTTLVFEKNYYAVASCPLNIGLSIKPTSSVPSSKYMSKKFHTEQTLGTCSWEAIIIGYTIAVLVV